MLLLPMAMVELSFLLEPGEVGDHAYTYTDEVAG